ncbi:MAG: RluA family pseudouridine synthase [Candidatus Omnitrophica bacterium]|nr:RluA family pseudouridine synthase [Candidatus Omnitrophota bacterium]
MNIPVVYEDNWLLVVNKPSGLLTIPAPKKDRRTLLKILNDDLKKRRLTYRLHSCHRLDRETSGLIIFAKGKAIQKRMMQEFKKKMVTKTYITFVQGRLSKNRGWIRNPVWGKSALTRYQVLQRFTDFSVVKVQPLTGRKNQIRLHFKQIRHPVLGEDRFVFRRDYKLKAKRLCLHAQQLDFSHPVTKEPIHLETELPEYFRRLTRT